MKAVLLAMFFAIPALAQNPSARIAPACGPDSANFNAQIGGLQTTIAPPEAGKARVYFIQDSGTSGENWQHSTLRIGIDGEWVGAYKNNSYFALSVEPGEHHICASVQSHFDTGKLIELAHFTAEAGKAYYFRTRFLSGISHGYPPPPSLDLDPVDSDQARYLIAIYPQSVWKVKK